MTAVDSQLIDQLKQAEGRCTPVVVYAPGDMDHDDDKRLRLAVFGGLVRMARTPDQLVDQAALLLHTDATCGCTSGTEKETMPNANAAANGVESADQTPR